MEQCTQHGELTRKTDQILSDISEIKGAIIGNYKEVGLIGKIDDVDKRLRAIEALKSKVADKVIDFVFKGAGTIAMGYTTLHISGILK